MYVEIIKPIVNESFFEHNNKLMFPEYGECERISNSRYLSYYAKVFGVFD